MKHLIFKAAIILTIFYQASVNAKDNTSSKSPEIKTDVEFYRVMKDVISEGFIEPIPEDDFIYDSLNGGLQGIDPHSSYINPKDYAKFRESVTGEFNGIGVQIIAENGFIRVIAPLDDSPASKAGIKPGDYITHIDGSNIYQLSIEEVSVKLKGKRKSRVKLVILRASAENPIELELIRDNIKSKSVTSKVDDNVGIIRISSFTTTTADELKKELEALKAVDGIIIDLRNNPGGILDQSIIAANFFLEKDLKIVSVKGKKAEFYKVLKENIIANDVPFCQKNDQKNCHLLKIQQEEGETIFISTSETLVPSEMPLVVLINKGSASASEILAGSLKDNKRAVIVGDISFGKGVVQSVLPILEGKKGALKLTTSKYYTPSGASIQTAGITPHVMVEDAKADLKENKFQNLFTKRESDLKNHAIGEKLEEIAKENEKYNKQKDTSKAYYSDLQLLTAVNIIKSLHSLK